MSDNEVRQRVLERYAAMQSPWGMWRMNAWVLWKRVSWRCLIAGALTLKRGLDIAGSLLLILALGPVFLALALIVKFQDGGPIFFRQTRVGKRGQTFQMLKFRTMCVDAEARLKDLLHLNEKGEGVMFKMKHDPRITPAGRWMRRFSLDELPQFFNVLKGDMSLVGPRPPLPREVALYSLADRRRLAVAPGITCLWQIGGRNDIDFTGQVKLDVEYIESQSLMGDVGILIKTVPAVLTGRGAS